MCGYSVSLLLSAVLPSYFLVFSNSKHCTNWPCQQDLLFYSFNICPAENVVAEEEAYSKTFMFFFSRKEETVVAKAHLQKYPIFSSQQHVVLQFLKRY